jgi:FkbM family methyltransferase
VRPTTIDIDGLRFLCTDAIEIARAQTLLTKEPGTIQWLRETVQPGDVVCDIGANIGCYTLLAARLVGSEGRVYACEPHVGNAAALLRNVEANGFADRVVLVTAALGVRPDWLPFHYRALRTGSSGHQAEHACDGEGRRFAPEASELKFTTSLDALVDAALIQPPAVVKIDIDGQELALLRGMRQLFRSGRLRSLQVETAPTTRTAIAEYLATCGYHPVGQHFTAAGDAALLRNIPAEAIIDNTIFAPAEATA